MRCAPFAAHAHADTRLHAETVIPTCMRSRFIDCKHPVAASTNHVFPAPPWGFSQSSTVLPTKGNGHGQ